MFIFLYVYAIWFYNHKIEINYYNYYNTRLDCGNTDSNMAHQLA